MAWQYTPIESGWLVGYNVTVLDYQHIEDDLHVWGGNVNAGANQLTNCSGILVNDGGIVSIGPSTSPVSQLELSSSGQSILGWYVTTGVATHKRGRIIYDGGVNVTGGGWVFQQQSDAGVFTGSLVTIVQGSGWVGIGVLNPLNNLQVHAGANMNLGVRGNGASQIEIAAYNDTGTASAVLSFNASGYALIGLPNANPGAGTKRLWYNPADSNRVYYAA